MFLYIFFIHPGIAPTHCVRFAREGCLHWRFVRRLMGGVRARCA